jgi:hypothetical protein
MKKNIQSADGYDFTNYESYDKIRILEKGGVCAIMGRSDLSKKLLDTFESLLRVEERDFNFTQVIILLCRMEYVQPSLGALSSEKLKYGFYLAGYDIDGEPSLIIINQDSKAFKSTCNKKNSSGV